MNPILSENKIMLFDAMEGWGSPNGCNVSKKEFPKIKEHWLTHWDEPTRPINLDDPNRTCSEKLMSIFDSGGLTDDEIMDISISVIINGFIRYLPNSPRLIHDIIRFRENPVELFDGIHGAMITLDHVILDEFRDEVHIIALNSRYIFAYIRDKSLSIQLPIRLRQCTLEIASLLGNINPLIIP